jgi:hypothetical protein
MLTRFGWRSLAAAVAKFSGFPNTLMLYSGLAGAPKSQDVDLAV